MLQLRRKKNLARNQVPRESLKLIWCKSLELERWSKRDAEVVVRSTVEIDFIAHIQAQSNRTEVPLQAAARVQHTAHITAPQSVDAAEEGSDSSRSVVETRVAEATFHC